MHRVRGVTRISLAAAVAVLGADGCADRVMPEGQHAFSTPPPIAAGPNDARATALPIPAPSPVWDTLSRLAAVNAGTRVMRAFARPSVSGQRWFRDLSPLLSRAAAQEYVGTDPARVPVHRVSGAAELLPSPSGYLGRVAVPTDVGRYTVILSRKQQRGPWLAERIQSPPGTNQ